MRRERYETIPIYAHNGSRFDFHLILSSIARKRKFRKRRIRILPGSGESIKAISFGFFQFTDSLSFLSASLDNCVENLRKSKSEFPFLNKSKLFTCAAQRELLLRKGCYPHEAFNSFQQIYEQRGVPAKELFASKLNKSEVSEEDYEHAMKVYLAFGCTRFSDYLKIYNVLDVCK